MDLTSPFVSNLRDLCISESTVSVPYLASIAMNMPFLERLIVQARVVIDNEHTTRILFPRLQHLDYGDQNFLEYAALPQECVLRTSCIWSEHVDAIANLTPRLVYDIQNGNHWLGIRISDCLFVIYNHETSHLDNTGDELSIKMDARCRDTWQEFLQDFIPRLTTVFPIITILKFQSFMECEAVALPFLCHFTGVRTLCLEDSNWDSLFQCLKQPYDNGSGPRMLLPALDTLRFCQGCRSPSHAEFKLYLDWRIEQGAPIKYVEVYKWPQDFREDWPTGNNVSLVYVLTTYPYNFSGAAAGT